MKIIAVDNFDPETSAVADRLVAALVNEVEGRVMLNSLRATAAEGRGAWYILVSDDFKMFQGMENTTCQS